VGSAGDVNGDGYADVVVGAPNYTNVHTDEGQVFVYYGNGGAGVSWRLRPFTSTGAPLAHLGHTDSNVYRLGVMFASPFGRGELLPEVEAKPLGQGFNGVNTFIPGGTATWDDGIPGTGTTMTAGHYWFGTSYHWRMRWRYNPATTPFLPASRWVTVPWNGWNEMDLRTPGGRVTLPLVLRAYEP
jgi:hypothetical protein